MQNSFCIFHCFTKTCPGIQPETYRMKARANKFFGFFVCVPGMYTTILCSRGHLSLTPAGGFSRAQKICLTYFEIGQTYFKLSQRYFFFTPGGV